MLDDFLYALGEGDGEQIKQIAPYFLGSIVLIQKDTGQNEMDTVDGQQRLITLSLLFACLRDRIPKFSNSLALSLRQKGDAVLERPDIPRINLRDRDQPFYEKYILETGGMDAQLGSSVLSDSQKKLWENALLLRKRLEVLDTQTAERLAQYVLQRCYLVVVVTADFRAAYRIFSVLNDRGMDLQATDILKSDIIGKLPDDERDPYTKKWEDAEVALGRNGFVELMAHIRMIHRKAKPRKSVLDEMQEYVLPATTPREFINNIVVPLSDAMVVMAEAGHESTQHADEINGYIRCLQLIDNFDWVPPALAFYRNHHAEAELLRCFLRDLERLSASMMIRRVNINNRIDRYGSLLTAIEEGHDLHADGSQLQLSDQEKSGTLAALDGDLYLVTRIRRPVLLRLDQFLGDAMATYSHSYITVEHVLPQNPSDGSTWVTDFPNEDERQSLVHKLGNLVLLSRRKNSSANNKPFDEKKSSYFTKGGVSTFALTTDVISESAWTPDVIRSRQQRLVGVLRKGWRL